MQKIKRNPHIIIILVIFFVTGLVFASKFNVSKLSLTSKVLADEDEDGDEAEEADREDSNDDEDKEDDEDKRDNEDNEDEDSEDDSKRSSLTGTQKTENNDDDEDDDKDEVDEDTDENDEEDESKEEIKDISELVAKVENKISQVAVQGGSTTEFIVALNEVKDLVTQAEAKLASGDKAGAETLIETADDKLEKLEDSVKLVLGEGDDDENEEADEADETDNKEQPEISKEYKNVVAQFVHDLKATQELEGFEGTKKGIGRQISAVAQMQNASQERMAELLDKISERKGFKKFLIGPDLNNLSRIKEEIAKNQATIQVLTQLFAQADNANVKIILERQIQALNQENLKLQSYVSTVENTPSLFGWIIRIFS